ADLVVVAGTPLDFRLAYGEFGGKNGTPSAQVVHVADAPGQIARHRELAASAAGDLTAFFTQLAGAARPVGPGGGWRSRLRGGGRQATAADAPLLARQAGPLPPLRVFGGLARLLGSDAVVIGDGGDFVSYAGKYIEPERPGGWLDPGPYGCLGTGLGYA